MIRQWIKERCGDILMFISLFFGIPFMMLFAIFGMDFTKVVVYPLIEKWESRNIAE